jgi:hypothetical protein
LANEQRREGRLHLSIPVKVSGQKTDGSGWDEMTTSDDTSYNGASFPLNHPVQRGDLVLLNCPLPKGFRSYDLNEASYRVWALVRNVTPGTPPHVGVLFLGKNPPRGHEKNPGARYLLPTDAPPPPKERRRDDRLSVFFNIRLTRLDAPQDGGSQEVTVAEDVSRGGARVPTSLPISRGDILMVEELGGDFRTRAEVRNVTIAKNNVVRLNLQFLDAQAPDRLVR